MMEKTILFLFFLTIAVVMAKGLEVKHENEDCWSGCKSKQGKCSWCGSDGMCCKIGFKDKSNGCDGSFGGIKRHECVPKPSAQCKNDGLYSDDKCNNWLSNCWKNDKQQFMWDHCRKSCNYCVSGLNIDYGWDALKEHNDLRKKHGSPPLTLDRELSKIAADWAQKRVQKKAKGHSKNKYKGQGLGENIWGGWTSTGNGCSHFDMKDAVKSWHNEINHYDFNNLVQNKRNQNKIGHFSALVWKGSKKLGLGFASSGGDCIMVANYFPAGNIGGDDDDYVKNYRANVKRPLYR